ncbi:Structural maintenance of chromosomes protein 3 [Naganishia albida]|nr:Structural maintenance of chromosomes protein 3 [Naganishia albida]
MYIKTITIQGFKSYKDQAAVDPFSPKHNVVVGRNGSGKSNFFMAIRFVLGDAYEKMSREERAGLLHEGTGKTTTLSAFVEIVFDNSDGRFPTSLPETILRRTIGLKKDEYTLDRKSASKAEVLNLLESAGFSRSNPYYIVPQGRITSLTNMKDTERLDLLKEIAGTSVYENKRQESLKILEETNGKKEKITELLDRIKERLAELQEEQRELKQFQTEDKKRRCLEYTLYQKELEEVDQALARIEDGRRADVDNDNQKRQEFISREQEIKTLETDLADARRRLTTAQRALASSQTDHSDLIRARTELECQLDDARQLEEDGSSRREKWEEELAEVGTRVEEVEAEIEELQPELDEAQRDERRLQQSLDTAQAKLDALYAKQGRSDRFPSVEARDEYLTSEIETLESALEDTEADLEKQRGVVDAMKAKLEEVGQTRREREAEIAESKTTVEDKRLELERLRVEINGKQEQRKNLLKEDGKLEHTVASMRSEKEQADRQLFGTMDRDTNRGLQAVSRIAKSLRLEGVYGPLYSLFEVEDRYKTAVEVTAGNSLFHVVVDHDNTATRILEVMNRENSGRVTFMPLNRLHPQNGNLPSGADAIPMVTRLRFDPAYKLAFEQVFGRTIVCPDLVTCGQYTRSHGVSAITLDGDRVDRKGALTGGYLDTRRSRLDAIRASKTWNAKYEQETARQREIKQAILRLEQEISIATGNVQVAESERKRTMDRAQPLLAEIHGLQREQDRLREAVISAENEVSNLERSLQTLRTKLEAYQDELGAPFEQNLSEVERQQMQELSRQVNSDRDALAKASERRSDLASRRHMLQIELKEDLARRREELENRIGRHDMQITVEAGQPASLGTKENELNALRTSIGELEDTIEEMQSQIEEFTAEISTDAARLEELQTAQMENSRGILKAQKAVERYITKRQTLLTRKDECNKSIRDLGVLPEEAYTKYVNDSSEKLVKLLHKVNDKLKEFSHVNKRAFEQFETFSKQKDDLNKRKKELIASGKSIDQLVESLDQRKDEAIERTFKQVSKYFAEIFERLVPAGRGKLRMQKSIDDITVDQETQSQSQQPNIESYTGVSIEVSFNSKSNEGLRIQQLSGGQKSLVALATVFAIQKCDPAPFYLFDEIDANLDAQYRTAVAAMIHELSDKAQFITTTFRPEMLAQADKFYGVLFNERKVSSIQTIRREDAQDFIENV